MRTNSFRVVGTVYLCWILTSPAAFKKQLEPLLSLLQTAEMCCAMSQFNCNNAVSAPLDLLSREQAVCYDHASASQVTAHAVCTHTSHALHTCMQNSLDNFICT